MGTKPRKSGLLAISTGTVAGAAILALFSTLLGPRAPWFVDKLFAGPRNDVDFTVDRLVIDRPSPLPNPLEVYADATLGFQLTTPPQDWKTTKLDPGRTLQGLSITAIPLIGTGLKTLNPMFALGPPHAGDIVTTEFTPPESASVVSFTDSSEIDGINILLNPIDQPAYFEATLRTTFQLLQLDASKVDSVLSDTSEESRAKVEELRTGIRGAIDSQIRANWPPPQQVPSVVTVTTFRLSYLGKAPAWSVFLSTQRPGLATVLGLMMYANTELLSANIKSIHVSRDNRFALVDASVPLRNILVDGMFVATTEVKRFALIGNVGNAVHVATLQFLSAGHSLSAYDSLTSLFNSFRVYR